MNLTTKKILSRYVAGFVMTVTLMAAISGCKTTRLETVPGSKILVAIGIDMSMSVAGYRKVDTALIAQIAKSIRSRGGTIVLYSIGNASDESGLRCYIKQLPNMDASLPLSKQAELQETIDGLQDYNDRQVNEFLKVVEEQVLGPPNNSRTVMNTDINGFFKKVDILLGEPGNQQMTKFVFAYTDGVQSLDGVDRPSSYDFNDNKDFLLCLSGWKTEMPSKDINIKRFEDPQGFALYMESVTSSKN